MCKSCEISKEAGIHSKLFEYGAGAKRTAFGQAPGTVERIPGHQPVGGS